MGMAVSRGTFCCNVQDLFHFFWELVVQGVLKNKISMADYYENGGEPK